MDEEIETYSPDTEEQNPLPVKADTSGFEDVMEKDGLISTRLNEKVIIQRIARDLYKNATSGLRELYNNSARACRIAVKNHGEEKPLISISMDEESRELTITDNGIGMSKERFKKVLLELGTSDNLEAGEVGQFGMGFASYMTLSSVVVIDTRVRDGDQYRMIAKDGMSFQPVGDAEMEGYGTKLTMTCYPEVHFHELVSQLEKIAKYSGVPTVLKLRHFEYYPKMFIEGLNHLKQSSFDTEVKAHKTIKHDLVDIETDEFHLIALVTGGRTESNYDHIHLLNIPIESEIDMPFSWWVLNIKDERKFKPMPDRDRMTEVADKKLEGLLDRAIKKYFSDLDIENYQQFLDSDRKNEFLWLCEHQDYSPEKMRDILASIQTCSVRTVVYDTKHFNDTSLIDKLSDTYHVIYQGYKNRQVTEKLNEFEPNALLITTKKTKKNHWKEHVKFMEEFGIPTGRQILIDHKVKMPKADKSELELIGHSNERYYEHEMMDLDDIDENVIRVDTLPMGDVIRYVKKFTNPYTFVRNAPELDEYDARDYSDWLKEIPNIMCSTNKGAMSIEELADCNTEVIFCEDFIQDYEDFFKEDDRVIVLGSAGLLPLALHLNPECETGAERYNYTIPNDVKHLEFHEFVEQKYDVTFHRDEDKKFFCNNLPKMSPCFHTLFGRLLRNIDFSYNETQQAKLQKEFLEKILKFEPFDMEDEMAKIQFYYNESREITDCDSLMKRTLEELLINTKSKIFEDEYLKMRLMKELILPKIFGHIEFRKMVKQDLSYLTCYDVSIATHDTEFEFKDDMKVFDFTLQFKGCKLKINKGYCSVKMTVYLSL